MLDKNDQMAGGKTAAGAKAAAGGVNSGPKGSPANSGPKGGIGGLGGSNGAGSSGPSSASRAGAASAAASNRAGSNSGAMGAIGGGGPSAASRAGTAAASASNRSAGLSAGGGRIGGLGTVRDDRAPGMFNGGLGSAAGPALAGLGDRPFGSYAGPKGTTQLNQASRIANTRAQGYGALPTISASPGELDVATRVALAESSAIKNAYGRPQTAALQAVGDVMKNRALSGQFPSSLGGVVTQPRAFSAYNTDARKKTLSDFGPTNPDYAATKATLASIMSGETAPVVGKSLNYGNQYSIANPKSISNPAQRPSKKSQSAFAGMEGVRTFTDASNPKMQHTFGTIGTPAGVVMNGTYSQPSTHYAAAAPKGSLKSVADFAAKGKPATGASMRVADFAARGKPTIGTATAKIQDRISPEPGYTNPGRSYASIPSSGLPGYENPGRSFAGIPGNGLPGYQNPGRSFADISGQFPAAGAPEQVSQSQLRNPSSGMSFNPSLPGQMQQPNMDMAGYQSPMAGLPAIPGNPIGGMSFSPGLPGQMPGSLRSRSPAVSGDPQVAQGIPNEPGRFTPGYENPGRSYAGIPTSTPPQVQTAQAGQPGGFFGAIGSGLSNAVTGALDAAKPVAKIAWDNLDNRWTQFAAGLSRPAKPGRGLRDDRGRFIKRSKAIRLAEALARDNDYSVTRTAA